MAKGRKPGVSTVPENESKEARFVRLATARVNRILKGLEGLGKLSGSGYASTPDQVQKIFSAISASAEAAYGRFQGGPKDGPGFAL